MHRIGSRSASFAGAVSAIAIVAAATILAACVSPSVPDEAPSIVGTVETRTAGPEGSSEVTILVRGKPEQGAQYDAASIRVTEEAKVFRGSREAPELASPQDIAQGARVSVWFTGPVAESYPVQASAGTVLIED